MFDSTRRAYLAELAEWEPHLDPFGQPYGTGALPLSTDYRDHELLAVPRVQASARAGFPAALDLSPRVTTWYNQGPLPSCVAHSTAGMKSLEDVLDRGQTNIYNAPLLYTENGGDGRNGVDTRRVLQDALANGVPLLSGTGRNKIGSYAFAPRQPGLFESALKAAVAAQQPCVVATLLPQQFGWDSSGPATNAYHQMEYLGYDERWAIFLNTWGQGWGRNGFCRLEWSYLTGNNFQEGLCYAYTVVDAGGIGPPPPPPPPQSQITVTGTNLSWRSAHGYLLVQGQNLEVRAG